MSRIIYIKFYDIFWRMSIEYMTSNFCFRLLLPARFDIVGMEEHGILELGYSYTVDHYFIGYSVTFIVEPLIANGQSLHTDPAELTGYIGALMNYAADSTGIVSAVHSVQGNLSYSYLALVGF